MKVNQGDAMTIGYFDLVATVGRAQHGRAAQKAREIIAAGWWVSHGMMRHGKAQFLIDFPQWRMTDETGIRSIGKRMRFWGVMSDLDGLADELENNAILSTLGDFEIGRLREFRTEKHEGGWVAVERVRMLSKTPPAYIIEQGEEAIKKYQKDRYNRMLLLDRLPFVHMRSRSSENALYPIHVKRIMTDTPVDKQVTRGIFPENTFGLSTSHNRYWIPVMS